MFNSLLRKANLKKNEFPICSVTLLISFLVAALPAMANDCGVITFNYDGGDDNVSSVHVTGTFNDWAATVEDGGWEMNDEGNNIWTTTRTLEPGTYLYKFVVDGNWYHDENNPEREEDGYGGYNSILMIECVEFCGGEGLENDPYLICTADELNNVRYELDTYFKLNNDIDLDEAPYNEDEGWEPIGTFSDPFTGSFDGDEHTISGLFINRPDESHIGLFGYAGNDATISNLGLTDVDITGSDYVGSLMGLNLGDVSNSYATGDVTGTGSGGIERVGGLMGYNEGPVSNCYATVNVTGVNQVGGLAGWNGDEIAGSYATGAVTGTGERVGGLAGFNFGDMINSFATGAVSGEDEVGGLVGNNRGDVSNSYAIGAVVGSGSRVGGFVGENHSGSIENSYSRGDVSGDDDVGGFVGMNRSDISESYSTGAVSISEPNTAIGGFAGWQTDGAITNSFWDVETSEKGESGDDNRGATGKTTAEMKQLDTFSDWNILITDTELNDGYPFLSWQDDREDVAWLITGEELFCGGTGIENDPYLICTADELNNVRYELDAYFWLENDIDLDETPYNEGAGWEPIGGTVDDDPPTPFTGNFDGNGFQINNLFIDRGSDSDIGLFGYTEEATLTNVKLLNVDITGQNRTGSLVGTSIDTKVEDSHVTGIVNGNNNVGGLIGYEGRRLIGSVYNSYAGVDVTGNNVVGGLVGTASETTIKDSHASGNVTGNNSIGGLIGFNYESTIEDCYTAGDVTGNIDVGGLVGQHFQGEILRCFSQGKVTGQQNIGGLAGQNRGTITASYALGNVEVKDPEEFTVQLGGLIGYNMGPVSDSYAMGDVAGGEDGDYIGGLAGGNEDTMTNSFATGEVTGRDYLGGLVGGQWGTIVNSYYNKITTTLGDDGVGDGDDNGVTGLTTAEMNQITTFSADWDIAFTQTDLNDGYPFLAWQDDREDAIWLIFGDEADPEGHPRLFVTAGEETPVTTDHLLFGSSEYITIIELPQQGRLLLNASEVEEDDVISKDDVQAGKLRYEIILDYPDFAYGYDFDSFVYETSSVQRTLPIDLAATVFPYEFTEGWFLFSSPGVGQTVGELLGNIRTEGYPGSTNPGATFPTVYTLDQENYQWAAVTGSGQVLVQGAGLLVYVFEEDTPAEDLLYSAGPWASLDGSFTYDDLLWYDPDQGEQGDSHFLIGNPHPVAIHICNMLFEDANMANSVDIWAPWENDGHGGYINLSCDLLIRKETGSNELNEVNGNGPEVDFVGYVPPFVGFWVRTMGENPSLAITEADYVSMRRVKERETKPEPVTLVLSHDERNYSNTLNILFTDRGTEGLDEIDAIKLSPAGLAQRYLSFYAMDERGRKYALRSLPTLAQNEVTIPLGIETTEQGSYTLSWSLPGGGFTGANYYLRDHHAGTTTQLRDGQIYRFDLEATTVAKTKDSPLIRGDARGVSKDKTPRFELIVTADQLEDGTSELPAEIVLRQNYPNPFNPATIISYELPQQSHVRLDVYDMTGRHVAELVNEQASAGIHQVSFNAMNLSSGVYMYRLQAGGVTLTRQLTLIK